MDEIKKADSKSVFIWNIAGSFCNALSSMLLLVFVQRTLGSSQGDTFSIGFSIATLMASIGLFQVRVYQSTDVTNRFRFNDYFSLRIISCLAMLVMSLIYIAVRGYDAAKFGIVLFLCLYKLVDAFSDVFQGMFQQKEHLDLAGKVMTYRILISNAAFFASLLITNDLFISVLILFVGSLLSVLLFDIPGYRRFAAAYDDVKLTKPVFDLDQIKLLIVICLPLFLNAYLMNAVYNMPKLAIDTAISQGKMPEGTQSYYNILFMPASVINLFLIVFRPLLTTLAHHFVKQEYNRLNRILLKIIGGLIGFGILALIAATLLGIPVLSLVYGTGDALKAFKLELLLLILGGGINSISNMLDNAVTIIRKQQYLLVAYLLSYLTARLLSLPLTNAYGLKGASLTYFGSVTVLMVSVLIIYVFSIRKLKKTRRESE